MDAKKLYTLINNIANNNKDNPLPKSQNDEELANEFAQYFISRIKSIRDTLYSHPLYKPTRRDVSKLSRSSKITEDQVKRITRSMSSKCCELSVIPLIILKQILRSVTTPITKLINEPLEKGVFCR